MSKSEVIDSLIRCGMRHFAIHGYAGTSLRDVAHDAGVPLSSINAYFGTKVRFYEAVEKEAWDDLRAERLALLDIALDDGAAAPDIREIVHAIVHPTVRRYLSADEALRHSVAILNEGATGRIPSDYRNRIIRGDNYWRKWIEAIRLVYPKASHDDIVWAYSLILGAVNSWQMKDHMYSHLLVRNGQTETERSRFADAVSRLVTDFCAGGIRAVLERKEPAPPAL